MTLVNNPLEKLIDALLARGAMVHPEVMVKVSAGDLFSYLQENNFQTIFVDKTKPKDEQLIELYREICELCRPEGFNGPMSLDCKVFTHRNPLLDLLGALDEIHGEAINQLTEGEGT